LNLFSDVSLKFKFHDAIFMQEFEINQRAKCFPGRMSMAVLTAVVDLGKFSLKFCASLGCSHLMKFNLHSHMHT
jgi:hypothetical protein